MADLDGDGRLDLVSGSNCCNSAGFHLFLRKSDGSWEPRRDRHVESKAAIDLTHGFATAADYDGDGVPDLLMRVSFGKAIGVAVGPLTREGPFPLAHEIDLRPKLGKDENVSEFTVAD